jgi:hypothetical protein
VLSMPRPTIHSTRRLNSMAFIILPHVDARMLLVRRGLIRALGAHLFIMENLMADVGDVGFGGCMTLIGLLLAELALSALRGRLGAWAILLFAGAGFFLIFGVIGLAGGFMGLIRGLKRDKPRSYVDSRLSSWRGELGSSGIKGVTHSANCECDMCLYGHDPDDALNCKCRSCEGYRRGEDIHRC